MRLLGYEIDTSYSNLLDKKKSIINTINPHSYILAKKDIAFQVSLKSSDVLLPDGIGIVWAIKVLHGKKIRKISGYDIFTYLMNELNKSKGSCFFMGSSEKTLKQIKKNAKVDFSNVDTHFYSPPFKSKFSKHENNLIIENINKVKPTVLFVGMTAPKQEKWVYENKDNVNANIICSIGAVFDFYAGTVKRSSPFWINIGLEWVPRFFQQPSKLWRRVFISNPLFVIDVLKNKFF